MTMAAKALMAMPLVIPDDGADYQPTEKTGAQCAPEFVVGPRVIAAGRHWRQHHCRGADCTQYYFSHIHCFQSSLSFLVNSTCICVFTRSLTGAF
jgi:hypothetical protein